ncbi:MAG: ABC transporter ATP-binding protein/permease [Lachnospiraceae bacterium]|nr:ABC transporter ATP-binding protein/permease [Lachnospiraceae bacterium]
MKLLFELSPEEMKGLDLSADERIYYCVPADLTYDNAKLQSRDAFAPDTYLIVTDQRLCVLTGGKLSYSVRLSDCEKIKCDTQVHSGIVTVTERGKEPMCAARFSMKHIIRAGYVCRGAQNIIDAIRDGRGITEKDRVVSREPEKYCLKCGRALPGTTVCPYCSDKRANFRKFFDMVHDYIGRLLFISFVMLIASGISVAIPAIQKYFINNSLKDAKGTMGDLVIFLALTLVLTVISLALGTWRYWQLAKLGTELSMSLRAKLYVKIQTLSLSFVDTRKPGVLMNRVSGDTARIRQFMDDVFSNMFSTLLTMIVALIYMFTISVKMTLMTFALAGSVFIILRIFRHRTHVIFHKQWKKDDELNSSLQDVISGMRIVKSFGQEKRESKRFTSKSEDYAKLQAKNESFWATFFPILTFILGGGTYIAVFFGGRSVLAGDLSVGDLYQYIIYCGYLFGPLNWMTHLPRAVMNMITSVNRIYDVLGEEPLITDSEQPVEKQIKGDVEFENITFGYQSYDPVLENVSFGVKAGEMIGLVGESGAGKSTIINLLMRLYDVDRGRITIDGTDIRDLSMESLHSQIGVVLQETFLFSGTIIDNIRYAKPDATFEEVIKACKAANAHDFICKTPDGYNTYVGEHGYSLSGGERQRISIARAVLNDPRLLILDEATSALDTESEFLIQQALSRLISGRTTFAIAHRLSTLRNADRIIVVDRHGIAEMGTHNELLGKKGIYYGLVEAQLKMAGGE